MAMRFWFVGCCPLTFFLKYGWLCALKGGYSVYSPHSDFEAMRKPNAPTVQEWGILAPEVPLSYFKGKGREEVGC